MSEASNQTATEKPVNPRDEIRAARARRMKLIDGAVKTVKVYPAIDDMRGVLRHANGTRFRATGGAEWPNDSFTARRIADGSVRLEDAPASERVEPDPTKNAREHLAANLPKPKEESQPEPVAEPATTNGRTKRQPAPVTDPPQSAT